MDFPSLRDSIALAPKAVYLNTGWAGPSPDGVLAQMRKAADTEARLGPAGPDGLAYGERVHKEATALAGRLLNVPAADVLLTHGTTEGVNIVLHGLDWQPGDELVTCDLEHPALIAPTTLLERRHGVTVKRVPIPPAASASQALDAIVQALTPQTRIVAVSHIAFTCGLRLPASAIVEAAHANGSLVLMDGAQTGGHIALDLQAMNVDFYAVSGQKWLLGPAGTGALYVNPRCRDALTPQFTAPGLDSRTGLRMHELTSGNVPLTAGFAGAIQLHLEMGPLSVEARIMSLAGRLRQSLLAINGVSLNGPTALADSSGLTSFAVRGYQPDGLTNTLWERYRIAGRAVRHPAGVRLSTAPFNNEDDVDRAVSAIAELANG